MVDAKKGYTTKTLITSRKQYEPELQGERERLKRVSRFVSHDLRNPLNVAEGYLELAQEDCDSEHLDAVAEPYDRMYELIEDMLTLVREGFGFVSTFSAGTKTCLPCLIAISYCAIDPPSLPAAAITIPELRAELVLFL